MAKLWMVLSLGISTLLLGIALATCAQGQQDDRTQSARVAIVSEALVAMCRQRVECRDAECLDQHLRAYLAQYYPHQSIRRTPEVDAVRYNMFQICMPFEAAKSGRTEYMCTFRKSGETRYMIVSDRGVEWISEAPDRLWTRVGVWVFSD
ncbi:MAG: hypothetical protein ACF8NJ_09605 [Phycisphaerales bacterium JB038]